MVNPARVIGFKATGLRPPDLTAEELRARNELTLGQRRHLLIGKLDAGMAGYSDLEAYSLAWARYGKELTRDCSERSGIVPRRPAGYWICEFPHQLEGDSSNPLHFGKVVPALADQPGILAMHDLLTEAELEVMGRDAQTV